jgi:DNA-binding transcriptional ArsR family regulator
VAARTASSQVTETPDASRAHGPELDEDGAPPARLDPAGAGAVATTLQALASPSRLLILTRLREAPCTVTALAEAVEMEQSAVSHQLRLLRHLGLVTATREGRTIVYALYDRHVALLLDAAIYHSAHLGSDQGN